MNLKNHDIIKKNKRLKGGNTFNVWRLTNLRLKKNN